MANKTAEDILNEIVTDGTGIEVTQDEALKAMKQIAKLAFDAGWKESADGWNNEIVPLSQLRSPESKSDREESEIYYENKEQFIKELFPE
jgi:hypothetical protein